MYKSVTLNGYRKVGQIAELLRQQIVDGTYPPGGRLPTRDELTSHLGVSKVTVQKALDLLSTDGFVVARGRHGTFVADDSPHLTRYMLLLPKPRETSEGNHFWRSMEWEARALSNTSHIDACHGFESWTGLNIYQELIEDIQHNRLAGLIFASAPYMIEGSPLLTAPGIPRTGIMSKPQLGVSAVSVDDISFTAKSLDHLAAKGCRRPAILCSPRHRSYVERITAACAQRGMSAPAHFIQAALPSDPWWAANLVALLFDRPPAERPDGLLIGDDNLVEQATLALVERGYGDPAMLPVVAACNFPWPTWSYRPVKRIGYHIRTLLQRCIDNIDLQRQGFTPPERTIIHAIGEDEIDFCHPPRRYDDPPPSSESIKPTPE